MNNTNNCGNIVKISNGNNTNYPIDDENTLHVNSCMSHSLMDIINLCKSHFGEDVDFSSLNIEAEHRHVTCIGYDRYDPSDYTDYLVITKT